MAISRTRPVPVGGLTDIVLTSAGLAASSSSVIQRWLTGASSAMSALSSRSTSALSSARLARVEIEPALGVADRAAGDGVGEHDRKQVQRGMGAHALVAPVPVDPGDDAPRPAREGRAFRRHVQDRLAVGVVDRVDDRDRRAVVEDEDSLIARLPAALRIEDRPVERDPPRLGERALSPAVSRKVAIVAEQGFGHRTKTSGAAAFASSQAGTARFLERRKAGLKSFEA